MAAGPEMRASDGDRDKVASVLREHYAQGRLTTEEFDERLEQLYTSKTYGELAVLTSDLPDVDLRQLPEAPSRAPERARADVEKAAQDKGLAAAWVRLGDGQRHQLDDLAHRRADRRRLPLPVAACGSWARGAWCCW